MFDVVQSEAFDGWLSRFGDRNAKAGVLARIDRHRLGNPGDAKSVGSGVFEMQTDYGPGYRIYYSRRGNRIVLLLTGGDKSTQSRDIADAIAMAKEFRDGR